SGTPCRHRWFVTGRVRHTARRSTWCAIPQPAAATSGQGSRTSNGDSFRDDGIDLMIQVCELYDLIVERYTSFTKTPFRNLILISQFSEPAPQEDKSFEGLG